jgi:hypothetical protein
MRMTGGDIGMDGHEASVRLRAHHLMCMQGFQGHGYSEEFVENMARMVQLLGDEPRTELTLLTEPDDICASCPHLEGGACVKDGGAEEEVRSMDRMVLEALGAGAGDILPAGEAIDKLDEALARREDAVRICGDCQWGERCQWLRSREE